MINLYLEYGMSKQLRERSLQSYKQTLGLFAAWIRDQGILEIEEIKDATIRKYILSLQSRGKYTAYVEKEKEEINCPSHRKDYGKPLTNLTINGYLRNIRGFFTWLVEEEYLDKSPMRRIKMLPHDRNGKKYLEDAEVRALFGIFDKGIYSEYRDMVIAMIMLDCGTRLGETLSIERNQLDVIQRTIVLPADKTKGRKERVVFFSQRTARELRKWIQRKERECDSDYIFPVLRTAGELSVRNYEANFRKYLKRTGIAKQVSPHTLRNNFARRCLMSGMDVYTLSRILGHSSVTVTEKAYLDVKDQELRSKYVQHSPLEGVYRR